MAIKFDKEALFENYFKTANETFFTFELVFKVEKVWAQIFNSEPSEYCSFSSPEAEQAAKNHVRSSKAWLMLSELYDYAVDGIIHDADPIDLVIDGAEVLSFITTENCKPAIEWEMIKAQGDGRYALDTGENILVEKLALLAAVDVRTIRNAVSAGELISYKSDLGPVIENSCARKWLNSRRGFKRTLITGDALNGLIEVSTPSAFGAFLAAKRKRLNDENKNRKVVVFHPSVDMRAIEEIETGVFNLPIDTVFPLADYYELDRKEFLTCVMEIFFSEQLSTLRETLLSE